LDPWWGLGILGWGGGAVSDPETTQNTSFFRKCSVSVVCLDFFISVIIMGLENACMTKNFNGIMLGYVTGIMDQSKELGIMDQSERAWGPHSH
jgi:hypothetical protein